MRNHNRATYKRWFECDDVEVIKIGGKLWLLLCWNRRTSIKTTGQWFKDGKPIDFSYVERTVVASGRNAAELHKSAKEYRRLQGMTWEDHLREFGVKA